MENLQKIIQSYISSANLNIEWLDNEIKLHTPLTPEKMSELGGRLNHLERTFEEFVKNLNGWNKMCVTLGINPDRVVVLEKTELCTQIPKKNP